MLIEKKPWGDHYRFKRIWGDKKDSIFFATHITEKLDKSRALLPWAIELVGSHVINGLSTEIDKQFNRDEIVALVTQAMLKPDEAKVAGGNTGTAIHTFAHEFALATMGRTALYPTVDHLDPEKSDEDRKILNGINAFLDWFNSHKVEFVAMEEVVYYNSLLSGDTKEGEPVIEFGGIMDLLAKVDGLLGVFDYKTGKAIYSDQRYQNSGYFKAYNANPTQGQAVFAGILNFGKETGELILGRYDKNEVGRDYDFGFKGLYLASVREKELKDERDALKKEEEK